MRIISKFHDYYDMIMKQGFDPKVVYKRETIEILPEALRNSKDWGAKWRQDGRERVQKWGSPYGVFKKKIFFCGKIYPLVRVEIHLPMPNGGYFNGCEDSYHYSAESAITHILKQKHIKALTHKLYRGVSHEEDIENWFSDIPNNTMWDKETYSQVVPEALKLSAEHRVPVITWNRRTAILNPCLNDLEFYKVVDPYTAFQELSMYMGNNLAVQQDPVVPVGGDIIVAESKGYNRFSFRQDGTTKKRKLKKKNRKHGKIS